VFQAFILGNAQSYVEQDMALCPIKLQFSIFTIILKMELFINYREYNIAYHLASVIGLRFQVLVLILMLIQLEINFNH
jgi:hypothetical protein